MKFLRNIYSIRENVYPPLQDEPCACRHEAAPAFSGKSLCSLAGEAPAL